MRRDAAVRLASVVLVSSLLVPIVPALAAAQTAAPHEAASVDAAAVRPAAQPASPDAAARRARDSHRTPVHEFAPVFAGAGAGMLGLGLGLYLAPMSPPSSPNASGIWRGGILLDEPFRDFARGSSAGARDAARTVSDILLVATMANAALVDGLMIPLVQDDPDLAWQASFAYSLAVGAILGLGGIAKRVSGRARPFERECLSNPDAPGCGSADAYQSFFSLHSGVAFTSAGFTCAMHLERNLYDDPGADLVACGSSLAAATAVGLLRVVADVHYLSDVLVGAAAGFLLGYLIPLAVVPQRNRHALALEDEDLLPGEERVPTTPGLTWSVSPMVELGGLINQQNPANGPFQSQSGITVGAQISGTF